MTLECICYSSSNLTTNLESFHPANLLRTLLLKLRHFMSRGLLLLDAEVALEARSFGQCGFQPLLLGSI
ncbi:hypothetical protein GX441_10220 [bacterium]|nr:hypothetical protein [bacterium]